PYAFRLQALITDSFISYPLLKLVVGKHKEVHPLMYAFAILFAMQLMFLPH
ncbi:MAG: NCS2 family permease, partial [Caryophanon sp.]|nr:NCS2 family permease [Caryophanon sp.]